MFDKLKTLWNLLHQGQQVADPEFWKGVQSKGQPVIAGLLIGLVALLKGTKYELPLDDATAGLIAGGIFAAANWVLTTISSKKVGLDPATAAPTDPAATTTRFPPITTDLPVVNPPAQRDASGVSTSKYY